MPPPKCANTIAASASPIASRGPHDDRVRKSDAHGRCAVNTSNQALELTTAPSVSTSSMTTSFPPDLTLAPSGRSSA
jgi:hypothetical protein